MEIMVRPIISKLVWYSPFETISLLKQTGLRKIQERLNGSQLETVQCNHPWFREVENISGIYAP